jgi:hypothetical protein
MRVKVIAIDANTGIGLVVVFAVVGAKMGSTGSGGAVEECTRNAGARAVEKGLVR